MKIDRSNDIYSLDETIADDPKAPREIVTYDKDVSGFDIGDSNMYRDFVESIKLF